MDACSLEWSGPLGFVDIAGEQPQLDGRPFLGRRLDMGPGSVEAWLARVVADELGIPETERQNTVFDPEAQELALPSGRVGLTPLELGVLSLLYERAGRPVSRAELLERVWGCDASAASNVVDAVVLTIRRKLGAHAATIETVRGVGYRYRA
jgi:DNA-binding response OmpR family regulator